jgi:hypothetical protein
VLGTDEDGAVALLYKRRQLVLVEQRGLGWVAGRRERQRAVARSVVKSPPTVGIPSWFEPGYCLQVLGMNEDRASRCRAADDDFFCWSNGVLGGWQVEERARGAVARFEVAPLSAPRAGLNLILARR